MNKDDGGPAFPHVYTDTGEPAEIVGGMTLRDYFASHAPTEPWPHYRPRMSPHPDRGIAIGESGRRYISGIAAEQAEGDCWSYANQQAVDEWEVEKKLQHFIQWPYFYADAMLKERTK